MATRTFVDILDFGQATKAYQEGVLDVLWTINYWGLGQKFLRRITEIATSRTFRHTSMPFRPTGALTPCYMRGTIYFTPGQFSDPNHKVDPTQDHVVICEKQYIYMFHELVHFYHDLLGRFSTKQVH